MVYFHTYDLNFFLDSKFFVSWNVYFQFLWLRPFFFSSPVSLIMNKHMHVFIHIYMIFLYGLRNFDPETKSLFEWNCAQKTQFISTEKNCNTRQIVRHVCDAGGVCYTTTIAWAILFCYRDRVWSLGTSAIWNRGCVPFSCFVSLVSNTEPNLITGPDGVDPNASWDPRDCPQCPRLLVT